jgi:Flp pilus assembly protein TadD
LTRRTALAVLLGCALVLAAAVAFRPVGGFPFISYDDDVVLVDNPRLRSGLTAENVVWAFTTTKAANWVPLTWLSHLLDAQLFGLDPGAHHRVNLLLHLGSAVLLFWAVNALTGALWRSALVAALFALHPLHVESVAWVTLRRDVLSALFGFAALGLYARYARRPTALRYAAVAAALALGLMAKPMLVTWPFLLLLLDAWPLGRFRAAGPGGPGGARGRWPALVLEKAPLAALAAAAAIVTLIAQRGAVAALVDVPASARVANALLAYASYLAKTVWPRDLAVFYPHPGVDYSAAGALASALLLAAITAAALLLRRGRPWLAAGWFWFLGTLVPVIGLVQTGDQAMADRYTYLPLTGLFVIVAWTSAEIAASGRRAQSAVAAATIAALAVLGVATRLQVGLWRDSETLFRHALQVTTDNHLAHDHLGVALDARGRTAEAIAQYRQSLAILPGQPHALSNLGADLVALGRFDEALACYTEALRRKPDFPQARVNFANLLVRLGRDGEALGQLRAALASRPDLPSAHYNLGILLHRRGATAEAARHLREAVRLDPGDPDAHNNLGVALSETGRPEEAVAEFREALRLRPQFAEARQNLAIDLRTLAGGGGSVPPSPRAPAR